MSARPRSGAGRRRPTRRRRKAGPAAGEAWQFGPRPRNNSRVWPERVRPRKLRFLRSPNSTSYFVTLLSPPLRPFTTDPESESSASSSAPDLPLLRVRSKSGTLRRPLQAAAVGHFPLSSRNVEAPLEPRPVAALSPLAHVILRQACLLGCVGASNFQDLFFKNLFLLVRARIARPAVGPEWSAGGLSRSELAGCVTPARPLLSLANLPPLRSAQPNDPPPNHHHIPPPSAAAHRRPGPFEAAAGERLPLCHRPASGLCRDWRSHRRRVSGGNIRPFFFITVAGLDLCRPL